MNHHRDVAHHWSTLFMSALFIAHFCSVVIRINRETLHVGL